ncbi:MAG: hypothetical protein FJ109_10900 [Deltaproteobacteria bacterium]|nr:hypothetical protein [Deltaproteobacteria bacterium]
MTDNLETGTTITFMDEGTSRLLQDTTGWGEMRDVSIESKKDLLVKVGANVTQAARFYEHGTYGVQLALDGGLRWGSGALPNALAYYDGQDSKLHIKPIYAGSPPAEGAELKLGSNAAEFSKDLDLGGNKLKWGANAEFAYSAGTVSLNSAHIDLDSGKSLKWGSNAEIVSSGAGVININSADLDLDSGKKVKWGSYASIRFDPTSSALLLTRSDAQLRFSGSIVTSAVSWSVDGYLYMDGGDHTCWLRYVSADAAVKLELGNADLWIGTANEPGWLKMIYRDSRYVLSELNLEAYSDEPSGAANKGHVVLRFWTDGERKCRMYLSDGTNWFYKDFTRVEPE